MELEVPGPLLFKTSGNSGIQPPRPLDVKGNIADNWKAFKQAWSNYAIIMNVNTQPESYKVALFLHCVGPDTLKIFNGMSFSNPSDREKVECIIAKFDEFTIGEVNSSCKMICSWRNFPYSPLQNPYHTPCHFVPPSTLSIPSLIPLSSNSKKF